MATPTPPSTPVRYERPTVQPEGGHYIQQEERVFHPPSTGPWQVLQHTTAVLEQLLNGQIDSELYRHIAAMREAVIELDRIGPGGTCHLRVGDHDVPYISLGQVTPEQVLTETAWAVDPEVQPADPNRQRHARALRDAVVTGEPVYVMHLDDRYGSDYVTESEVNRWAWFLANAMAVAAGYTSHGENSRRVNRHGVSRK